MCAFFLLSGNLWSQLIYCREIGSSSNAKFCEKSTVVSYCIPLFSLPNYRWCSNILLSILHEFHIIGSRFHERTFQFLRAWKPFDRRTWWSCETSFGGLWGSIRVKCYVEYHFMHCVYNPKQLLGHIFAINYDMVLFSKTWKTFPFETNFPPLHKAIFFF